MKFFEKDFVLKAINEMRSIWNDASLTCLCIHKELRLKDDSAKENWHQISKNSLKSNLAFYFDLNEKPISTHETDTSERLSIIFAQQYEKLIQQVEICYLAAICFRKQGIPDYINDASALKNYLIEEFSLPPHFQTRIKNTLSSFPDFVNQSPNDDIVKHLLEESKKDKAECISLGPRKILGDSAGDLGAAYFQTLYSKMLSQICLVTSIPEQYPIGSFQPSLSIKAPKENNPLQIIYYGVPGCGKSHQIQEDLKAKGITEENHQQKRVVFHPDYCNADFIGQILPITKKDGGIRYQFKAGPFTKILRDAYENPGKEYALIIEEINRGNAAAIFGDLFQLLDRKRDNDPIEKVNGNSYGPGWSDYCVENDYINAYFRGAYDSEEIPDPLPPKTLGNIAFNDNVDIRLPPNLSLYATMNTSDQNVFTLDNAFQRRWEMKQVSNELKNDDEHPEEKIQYNQLIGDTGVKWGAFRDKINEIIMQSAEENGLSSMEDKRLGGWFIAPKKDPEAGENVEPVITKKAFAEKVLKYLWDDAFKFDRKVHFDNSYKTLEDLINAFVGGEGFKVFTDTSINGPKQEASTDEPAATES